MATALSLYCYDYIQSQNEIKLRLNLSITKLVHSLYFISEYIGCDSNPCQNSGTCIVHTYGAYYCQYPQRAIWAGYVKMQVGF